jgi:hypothetical protein
MPQSFMHVFVVAFHAHRPVAAVHVVWVVNGQIITMHVELPLNHSH